jgi:hypothetical protein
VTIWHLLHLVPRLRMSGSICLLPLYAFMNRTGTPLPLLWSSRNALLKWRPWVLELLQKIPLIDTVLRQPNQVHSFLQILD